jgi:tRNA1(Val) A37 N6-methylase TrmN6
MQVPKKMDAPSILTLFNLFNFRLLNLLDSSSAQVGFLWLVQLEAERMATVESSLCIHTVDGSFSKEYRNLTSEFYMDF